MRSKFPKEDLDDKNLHQHGLCSFCLLRCICCLLRCIFCRPASRIFSLLRCILSPYKPILYSTYVGILLVDLKQINLNHTGFINNVPNLKSATKVWGSDYNASKLKALLKHKKMETLALNTLDI